MGFTWPQLYLVLGLLASVMAGGWIIAGEDNHARVVRHGGRLAARRHRRAALTARPAPAWGWREREGSMNRKLSPAAMVILVAAAFMTLGSFLAVLDDQHPERRARTLRRPARGEDRVDERILLLPGHDPARPVRRSHGRDRRSHDVHERPIAATVARLHLEPAAPGARPAGGGDDDRVPPAGKRGIFDWGAGFYVMVVSGIGLAIGALIRAGEETASY